MAYPTPSEILEIAAVCQYLAADDERQQMFMKGGFLRKGLSLYIFMIRKGVQWLFDTFPNDPTLVQKSNYLYWLCTPYIAQGTTIINNGGEGTIVNPSTGITSIFSAYLSQFVIGEMGSPMVDGETVLTITANDFIVNSVDVALDGVDLPINRNDRISYTIVYSSTQIVITFNVPVSNGQLYEVRGLRLIPV